MLSLAEGMSPAFWPLVILSLCAQAPGQEIQPRSILNGHTSFVYCVAVNPKLKSLASGARDGVVICWDVGMARPKWTAQAHKDNGNGYTQVLSVAYSPDGKTLASGGWDCTVRLWDAASGDQKLTLPHENLVYSVAFSPDGKALASGEHQTGVIHLWDVGTGKSTGDLAGGSGSVRSVAFSPDGKALASGGYVVRQDGGGVVRLWDLSTRTLKLEIPAQPLGTVALSPDGQLVAGAGYKRRAGGQKIDGLVRLWDTRTGELHRTWTVVGDGRTSVGPVAFSPDGRLLAGGGMVGERARERKPGEIYLWNIEANRLVWRKPCHDDDVTCLAFTAHGKTLVSGGRDMAVKLWEIR
ncbi:MAG: WD40 repeat domain-containing protein [Isosphaerales bacterium]